MKKRIGKNLLLCESSSMWRVIKGHPLEPLKKDFNKASYKKTSTEKCAEFYQYSQSLTATSLY